MGGLSSYYILSKLSAEKVTEKTKQLILDFLNGASNARDIAGIEHQEGPVFDDPDAGYGDQIRDYDIGLDVAQRIINKRNSIGGFTSLTQLAGIPYFGQDKFNDVLYSFARRVTEISAIMFNYNNGDFRNDGLNIRKNRFSTVSTPSWQKGISSTYTDSPAAYTIKETQGNPIAIRASFKANGISAAYIRAIGGGRLGKPKEKLISFDSAGGSGYETFELENTTFHSYGVDRYYVSWRWQWRLKTADTWKDLDITRHRIFVILQAPTEPWVQTISSLSLPWTDALEIACKWAKGAKTRDEAAGLITEAYNGCGMLSYDTASGMTMYGSTSFNLTEMIERLNGGAGLGGIINCTDSANTVSTLANLIGCDLWQSRMGSGFYMNEIIPIGYSTWSVPFWGGFGYHEVAWKDACTQYDNLFDGCLKVDGDADPTTTPHTPLLPKDMLFGDCGTMNYRLRLCTPASNGCPICQAKPETKKRRPII